MKFLKSLLMLSAVIALLTIAGASIYLSVALHHVTTAIDRTEQEVQATSKEINSTIRTMRATTDDFRRAAIEQRKYWNQSGEKTVKLLADSDLMVRSLITSTNQVADSASVSLNQITVASTGALNSIAPALQSSQRALDAMSAVATDPRISQTLTNVQDTTAHLANSTKTIDQELNRPRGLWKSILTHVLEWTANVVTITHSL